MIRDSETYMNATNNDVRDPVFFSNQKEKEYERFFRAIRSNGITLHRTEDLSMSRKEYVEIAHSDVIKHLIECALAGKTLEEAADRFDEKFPGRNRLDEISIPNTKIKI